MSDLEKVALARRSLMALYAQVPEAVADDVHEKMEAVIAALEAAKPHEVEISFTSELTGKRYKFDNTVKLIEEFLKCEAAKPSGVDEPLAQIQSELIQEWDELNRRTAPTSNGMRGIETAPKGVPVIVAGGIAMQKTGGEWYTGMEEPLFMRRLEWQPKWWMPIPTNNDALTGQKGE